ncbi:hypothetical protein BGZ60DRAFT_424488 [Tricladium varicosporioides]|nr:hypothetical protein BGZ60DRAFT_424488 [Hymenoscyphus varicosporioides]
MTERTLTTGQSEEYITRGAVLLSAAFLPDATITYLLSSLSTKEAREAYHAQLFHVFLKAAVLNGGSIDEVDGWKSCGVLLPPGCDIGNPFKVVQAGFLGVMWTLGLGGIRRMSTELEALKHICRDKVIPKGQSFYTIFFLGTAKEGRGKGMCSQLLKHYQTIARGQGLPIWMEASNPYCARIYERAGWKHVEPIVVGKGKCGADGVLKEGGEGLTIYGMVWWPEKAERR